MTPAIPCGTGPSRPIVCGASSRVAIAATAKLLVDREHAPTPVNPKLHGATMRWQTPGRYRSVAHCVLRGAAARRRPELIMYHDRIGGLLVLRAVTEHHSPQL